MNDYLQKFKLENKTAIVIGGLGLIGKEVVNAFIQSGASVIILDLESSQNKDRITSLNDDGFDVHYETFDCADLENLEKNFLKIISKYKCPDISINCSYPRTLDWATNSFSEVNFNSFRKNIDIHLNTYAWLSRLSAEKMVNENIPGSIITMSSIYGVLGQDLSIYKNTDMKENMSYSVIKGAIVNMTRQMASYYGQYNIRVNTVISGGVNGPVAGKETNQTSSFLKNYSEKTPLNRLANPHEIASAIQFLASDASSYMTGSLLVVDGGWSAI